MLRLNMDTKIGLVNGALGSIKAITSNYITVKFDHIDKPYNVEMVKSRYLQKTVSTYSGLCYYCTQMPGLIT